MVKVLTQLRTHFTSRSWRVSSLTIAFLIPSVLIASAAIAGQIGGRSYFDRSPRLIRSNLSMPAPDTPGTYEFTIRVPQDAGAPLQAVRIAQEQGISSVPFSIADSSAFLGDRYAAGSRVSIAPIGGEMPKDSNEATVVFNPPIQPGQTVTVALESRRNPHFSGPYLFGVTAYPQGDTNNGLFLGFGRFQIYSR